MTANVVIMNGIPASGKSTKAKEIVKSLPNKSLRVNRDSLRDMMHDSVHTKINERMVVDIRNLIIEYGVANNITVVVDDTNFENNIPNIIKVATAIDPNITTQVIKCEIDVEEAVRRDALREKSVGEKVVRDYANRYIPKKDLYIPDNSKPKAIICDLDGTLSIIDPEVRGPFEAEKSDLDTLNAPVARILALEAAQGTKILLLSGRQEKDREPTLRFLKNNGVYYDFLYMRTTADQRKDSIIKKELFDKYIRDNYSVQYVLDDRDQVVDLWRRELGLVCFQVNYGTF